MIVGRVRGGDPGIESLRDLAQEVPPSPAKLGLGVEGLRRSSGFAGEAQTRGS
jgi:hypothetical protein